MRWGLICPEPDDFLSVVCVFSGDHATRREFKRKSEFFINNQTKLTGPQLRVAWTVFAEAFFVEAREVMINCRRFSVPSYLSLLGENSENEGRLAPSYTVAVRPGVT